MKNHTPRPPELCFQCGSATGRAGRCDGSIYLGDHGPYCSECHDALCEAAPDMLDAFEALGVQPYVVGLDGQCEHGYCFCLPEQGRDPGKPKDHHTGECRDARAAIRKARGV